MDSQRPPEPLKDRLATIVQRGHVEKWTADEVAELILREIGTVSLSNEQIEKLEAQPGCFVVIQCDSCAVKDARIAELEKDAARLDWLERNGNFIEVGHTDISCSRSEIDAAISAATKEGE